MFEYDPVKSVANRAKHGIDFVQAERVWDDKAALMVPARSETEERFALIGCIDHRCWTVVATIRGERVRIISARRSREAEVKRYEQTKDDRR